MAKKKIQLNIDGEALKKKLNIRNGIDGKTPVKGVDYRDGIDGISPDVSIIAIEASKIALDELLPTIPTISQIEEKIPELGEPIVESINALPTDEDDKKIDASHIKNLPKLVNSIGAGGKQNLYQLNDVSVPTPSNGNALIYNSTTRVWEAGSAGSTSPLTTKGDLYGFSTVDARIPISGTDGYVLTEDSTDPLGVSWQAPSSATSLTYMFTNDASDIATYYEAQALSVYVAGALGDITTAGVSTTPTVLGRFVTNLGYPNVTIIPAGTITIHYDVQKVAGSNNYYTYAEIYKRNLAGTETLLATTDQSSSTAVNTQQNVTVTSYSATNISLLATDRLVVKVYGVMVSSTATLHLYFDDATSARIEFPTTFVDATNYVTISSAQTISGAKTFSADVNVPDEAYGAGWNASLEVPTKNAVYDKIQALVPGSDTQVIFNDGGSFGADAGIVYNKTTNTLGVNEASPTAHMHAGTTLTDLALADAGITTTLTDVDSGYTEGSGSKTLYVYTQGVKNSITFYSTTALTSAFSEPVFYPSSPSASFNTGGSGYTADGSAFTFDIYAVYQVSNTRVSATYITSGQITDPNDASAYSIDISWTAPGSITPLRYLLVRHITGGGSPGDSYQVTGDASVTFSDTNSGWNAGTPTTNPLYYQLQFDWTPSADALGNGYYVTDGTNYSILTPLSTATYTFANTGTAGSSPTPLGYYSDTFVSESTTELMKVGGRFGAFAATPVVKQTGDVATALTNYGWMTSPTIAADSLKALTAKYILYGGSGGNFEQDADIAFDPSTNAVMVGFGIAGLNLSQGVTQSLDIATQLNIRQNASSTSSSTGTINNFATAGNYTVVSLTGAAPTITGITNGSKGCIRILIASASTTLTITNQDTGSTAVNRIITGTGGSIILPADGIIMLYYDDGVSRWRVFAPPQSVSLSSNNTWTGLNTYNGGLIKKVVTKTAAYTLTASDYEVVCTSGSFNLTLPTAVGIAGTEYVLTNAGTGKIGFTTSGSQTIGGEAPAVVFLNQYQSITVRSDGSNWNIYRNRIQVGKSTSVAFPVGVIGIDVTSAATAGTTEETLKTITIPADALSQTGETFFMEFWGYFAANANNKYAKVVINTTGVVVTDTSGYNGRTFYGRVEVSRTGSNAQLATGVVHIKSSAAASIANTNYASTTETDTANISLYIKADGGAAGDVTILKVKTGFERNA